MKKIVILSICFLLILMNISTCSSEIYRNQNIINLNNEIDDIGWYTSLDLDKNGYPHISYYDYTNGNLKYCYLEYNNWEIQTVDSIGNVGRYTSIVLDDNDDPHISYYDLSKGDLKYAYKLDNNWNIKTVDSWRNVGLYTSIDVDSKNNPHISYCDYDSRTLKYAYYDGSIWKKTVVDNTVIICSHEYFSDYTSITLDDNDIPHISYCDIENFDLKYANLIEGNWVKETVDGDGDVGVYSSIAVDKSGNIHICYADLTYPSFNLKYATKKGGEWNIDIIDKEGDIRKWTSLYLDSDNNPHISYYDYTEGALKYIHLDDSAWIKESVEVNGSTGLFNSINLNSEGQLYISYYDWGFKALKLASKSDDNWKINTTEIDTNNDFIDQEQKYCSGYASAILDDEPMAQSFKPEYSVITRVELMVVKRYNPGGFTVSIRKNLTDEDITSIYLSPDDIPEDISWKLFDFPDVKIIPGETYFIVCKSDNTEENNMYFWYFGHGDPYNKGNGWIYSYDWEIIELSGFPGLDFGFKTFGLNTNIPSIPDINGPTAGKIGVEYSYNISSYDEDNDELWYEVVWSSVESDVIGPFQSGEITNVKHTYDIKGDYNIRVKAIDIHGAESDWATLTVSMPKYKKYSPEAKIWFVRGIFKFLEEDDDYIYEEVINASLYGLGPGFYTYGLSHKIPIKIMKPFYGIMPRNHISFLGIGVCRHWDYII